MIIKTLPLVFSALALSLPTQTQANSDEMDFSTLSCQNFMQYMVTASDFDAGSMLVWLDGYLSGISGDTLLNSERLEYFGGEMARICTDEPDMPLLEAAEEVGLDD